MIEDMRTFKDRRLEFDIMHLPVYSLNMTPVLYMICLACDMTNSQFHIPNLTNEISGLNDL